MAKRFFETTIWDEDWYLVMPPEYKLFFQWVLLKADHAGFFKPNIEIFNKLNGTCATFEAFLRLINDGKQRIRVLENGRWFIEDFISFQYGSSLNPANRLHFSIFELCGLNGVKLESIRGLNEVSDTSFSAVKDHNDRVKDKDKEKEKRGVGKEGFALFWQQYPKKKSKGDAEKAWLKINPTKELLEKMLAQITAQKQSADWQKNGGQYIPYPASWLNSRGWEDDVEITPAIQPTKPDDYEKLYR